MRHLTKLVLSGAFLAGICVTLCLICPGTAVAQQAVAGGAWAMPNWDAGILQATEGTCRYCSLSEQARADALEIGLLSSPVVGAAPATYFANAGAAGTARQYTVGGGSVTMRDIDKYLSFGVAEGLPPLTPDTTSRIPSEATALASARTLATQLGIPTGEVGGVQIHGLAISGGTVLGAIAPTTVGRAVEFWRTVGGYRVLDSAARFEFGRDGVLKSVLVHWPQFRLKPGMARLRDRSAVLAEVGPKTNGRVIHEMEVVFAQGADGSMTPMMLVVTAPRSGIMMVSRDLVPLTQ